VLARSAPAPDWPRPHSSAAASRWRPWKSPYRSSPPYRRARQLAAANQRRLPLLCGGLKVAATEVFPWCSSRWPARRRARALAPRT
jgi:hypothetical protein